jgi:two-component system response regulator MtrA
MTRIIVVDDDPNICDLVSYRLSTMGMTVDTFRDGQSGLDAIVSSPPDLAIVDVLMPRMNGLDVVRAVRANAPTMDLPIIMFTALGRPEDQEAAHAAGAKYYAIKPFSVLALGAYVEKILGLVACVACGRTRGVNDPDYSPEQVLQHAQIGWTVTVDGQICGVCREAVLARRGLQVAPPANSTLLTG